jgi:hypothetical protein
MAGYAIAGSWHGTLWFARTDSKGNLDFIQTYCSIQILERYSYRFQWQQMAAISSLDMISMKVKRLHWIVWVVKADTQGNAQ